MIASSVIVAILLAVVFVGWGLRQAAEYERQADSNARDYATYTNEHIRQSCVGLAPLDQKECIAQARHEQRAYEREEYDLVAQRQSALWAYVMGASAVVGMGLSVVGVILVWTTFSETRESNVIARTAANAAIQDAKASRETLILAERAIIDVLRAWLDQVEPDNRFWPAVIRVKNEGRSNAHKFRVDWVVKSGPEWTWDFPEFRNLAVLCRPERDADLEFSIRAPKQFPAYLMGMVSYHTVHDANFKSFFCREITGMPAKLDSSGHLTHSDLLPFRCEGMPRNS